MGEAATDAGHAGQTDVRRGGGGRLSRRDAGEKKDRRDDLSVVTPAGVVGRRELATPENGMRGQPYWPHGLVRVHSRYGWQGCVPRHPCSLP